jgi:hypothetical protein
VRCDAEPTRSRALAAEDGVHYEALTTAMDDAQAAGFARLEVSSAAF